jgi:hypothetical protein
MRKLDIPEKRIIQHDILHPPHRRIIQDIPVDEEKHGQVDFFARADLLLFKAKALDFGKVRRDLVVSHYTADG